MSIAIIVHGGAGAWDLDSDSIQAANAACTEAAAEAQRLLLSGRSALDAVEAAVRIMEDNPFLDAGRGSFLNAVGEVELDALIMDGRTLEMGAIAAVQRVQNPISLARRVMQESEHNFLVGPGAEAFADAIGFPRCQADDLLVGRERERYQALRQQPGYQTVEVFSEPGSMGDTVGAVALDQDGNLAAATSTGGTRKKLPGRVGDSPLVGSGGYADNLTAAVSATGHGESLMKIVISKQVCDYVAAGQTAQSACDSAIQLLHARVNGLGGLIAIDTQGRFGFAFNTAAMPYAFASGHQSVIAGR